ncbi:MAG: general secretion pathway protein GspK [Pseudomonadales bacterium]|nr:general secretion pathway protein GspK [Pseudomonadales bacterium]MBO7006548.1 general secretion pathway protein GspK [Pseudomonadales bacterium]
MLLFAGFFSYFADIKYQRAIKSKQRAMDSLDLFATEQTVLYAFATNPVRRNGIVLGDGDSGEFIRLDGTPYQGFGSVVFQVNDYAGLVGLNSSNNYHLERLLTKFESSAIRRDGLLYALYDYTDADDEPMIGGKEAPAYRVAKLPPPSNSYLRSPVELEAVIGWEAWLKENSEFDRDWLSSNWRSRINLNTVPEELFLKVLDLPDRESERLLNRRRAKVFGNMEDVQQVLNFAAELNEDYFTFLPANEIRIRIYSKNRQRVNTSAIRFTPFRLSSAWEVNYRYQSEIDFEPGKPARVVAQNLFSR